MEKTVEHDDPGFFEVRIFQLLDDGFMLEVPSKTCAVNHAIALEVDTENSSPRLRMSANFKVISVEKISAKVDLIQIKVTQKSNQEWDDFQNLLGNRQSEINQFMNDVKGIGSK